KAYPKWVNGKIVKSKEEEELLLAERNHSDEVTPLDEVTPIDEMLNGGSGVIMPPVTKETRVDGVDPTVVEKPKKGRPKK
ncbi:MAG: hypothetical protein IMF19_13030, partial [Proteobacteria bacterium]|nr:hypothetical protein [Pseudomonadota bacterium]